MPRTGPGADAAWLNARILEIVATRPEGGGYRFEPTGRAPTEPRNPRDPHHDGVVRDCWVNGERVARAASDRATYCCGVTFELWLEAWRAEGGQDAALTEADAMLAEWFCPVMGHAGVSQALVARGLGIPVARDQALAGDLVQYWRSTDLRHPSGHSAVFLEWMEGPQGARVMRYWSSQPATGGLGVHQEVVEPEWELHFVRALRS